MEEVYAELTVILIQFNKIHLTPNITDILYTQHSWRNMSYSMTYILVATGVYYIL